MKGLKIILSLSILFQIIKNLVKCQECIQNCLICSNPLSCIQCEQGFSYDPLKNICVFTQCKDQLANQVFQDSQGNKYDQCVSICQNSYFKNTQDHVCQQLQQCSSEYFFKTSSTLRQGGAQQIILFQSNYLIVFYNQVADYIQKSDGELKQSIQYGDNVVKWQIFNEEIFLFRSDNHIMLWDPNLNIQTTVLQVQLGKVIFDSVIVLSDSQTGCLLTFDLELSIMYIYPFIKLQTKSFISSIEPLQISYNSSSYFVIQDFIILKANQVIEVLNLKMDLNQEMKIQNLITCDLAQANISNNNILDIIYIEENKIFYFLLANTSGIIRCDQVSITLIKTNQQPSKLQLINHSNSKQLFAVVFPNSLVIYNNDELVQNINQQNDEQIIDFQLIQISLKQNELYILLNSQQLKIYIDKQDDNNQLVNFKQSEIIPIYRVEFNILNVLHTNDFSEIYLALLGYDDFQFINRIKNNSEQNDQFIFSPFQNLPITNTAIINDILVLEDLNLIISCSDDGFILIWDNMHKYKINFRFQLQVQGEQCLMLHRFTSTYVIAHLDTRIVIFDASIGVILHTIQKQHSFLTSEFISCREDRAVLIYDYNFNLIDKNLNKLIIIQQSYLFSHLQMIFLLNNLQIIIQTVNEISIYQLDPTQAEPDSQITLLYQYQFSQSAIQLAKIKYFSILIQQQINYQFEVLVFDSNQSFFIFDQELNLILKVTQIPLQEAIDINFSLVNPLDPSYFIFGISSQLTISEPYQIYSVDKDSQSSNLVVSLVSGTKIMEPIVIYDNLGKVKCYQITIIMPLAYFTLYNMFRYFPTTRSNIFYSTLSINNENQASNYVYQDLSYNYIGLESGYLGVVPIINSYSQLIQTYSQDEIINVIQDFFSGRYFVISKKIKIYNLNNNMLIEEITLNDQEQEYVQGFQLFSQQQIFIAFKSKSLILKNLQTDTLFSYNKLTNLNAYFLENNFITVFGSKIMQLNLDLTEKFNENSHYTSTNLPQLVLSSSVYYYCKLQDGTLMILNKSNLSIIAQIKNKLLNGFYKIFIDEEMNHLFLYNNILYIYDLVGMNRSKQINLEINISQVQILGTYLAIVNSGCKILLKLTFNYLINYFQTSRTKINNLITFLTLLRLFSKNFTFCFKYFNKIDTNFLDRKTLQMQNQFVSRGGQINGIKYLSEINYLLIWTSLSRFSQITVYSMNSFSVVQEINDTFEQNSPSIVVDVSFDLFLFQIVYLDNTGNINCVNMDAFYVNCLLKMNEFSELNIFPKGISIDYNMNNIFVYSSSQIYQINYADINMTFKKILEYKQNQFIKINGQNSIENQFYVINSNNIIYSYKYNSFSYLNYFSDQDNIQQIIYLQNIETLVVSFKNVINIYSQFKPSNPSFNEKKFVTGYKFQQFLFQGVFITSDSSLVDYDFKENKENYKTSWSPKIMTVNIHIEQASLFIIGLNQGDCIIYDQKSLSHKQITIDSTPIQYITATENYFWVCSYAGIVKQFTTKTRQINRAFDLNQIVSQQINRTIGVFEVDEVNSRLFTNIVQQKLIFAINYSNQQLEISYLSFPQSYDCYIQFSLNFIFLQCSFQINIHNRESLLFLKSLRRDGAYDEIKFFKFHLEQFFVICFLNKFEIFSYNSATNTLTMIDQVVTSIPQILDIDMIQNIDLQLQVTIFSQDTFIVKRYTAGQVSQNLLKCSTIIQVRDYITTQLQLSQIQKSVQPSVNWKNMEQTEGNSNEKQYFLMLHDGNLNYINSNLVSVGEFIISSQSNASEFMKLEISSQIFSQFSKPDLNLKNLQYSFALSNQGETKQTNVNLSQSIQNVRFQNIQIHNLTNMEQVQFNFIDLTLVTIQNLEINSKNQKKLIRLLQNESNIQLEAFFYFQNCTEIYFYNLTIQNFEFINQLQNTLFKFEKIQKLVIDGLLIDQISLVKQIFSIQNVNQVIIKNANIVNSNALLTSISDSYVFYISGCQQTNITKIIFQNNENLLFLFITNEIKLENSLQYLQTDNIYFQNSMINNNKYQNQSNFQAVLQILSTHVYFSYLTILKNQANIQIKDSEYVQIKNSQFINNTSIDGGAIYFYKINKNVTITQSTFMFNQAQSSGGALYFTQESGIISIDSSNSISQNLACIGGGIRIYSSSEERVQQVIATSIFEKNKAQIYGDNFATFAQRITIQSNSSLSSFQVQNQIDNSLQNLYSGLLKIQNFKSGDNGGIEIALYDQEDRQISFDVEKVHQKAYPQSIIEEIKSFYFQIVSSNVEQIIVNGENFINYNKFNCQSNKFVLDNFSILSIPMSNQNLSINYQIKPSLINEVVQPSILPILAQIEFRNCQVGEINKYFTNVISTCFYCQDETYSLEEPKSKNQQCLKCPYSASNCEGNKIVLLDGYWRENKQTDLIIYCVNNPSLCKEDPLTEQRCEEGYTGPLCETCDNLGEVWIGKRYTKMFDKQYQCLECTQAKTYQWFIFILIICFLLYFIVSVHIFMKSFQHIQICYYLRKLKLLPISYSETRNQSNFYIKILINYLQLSNVLIEDSQYSIFQQISFFPTTVGQPSSGIVVGIDCMISIKSFEQFGYLQYITVIQAIAPGLFLIVLIFFLRALIFMKIKGISRNLQYIIFGFIFVFFQPNQVTMLSKLFICRTIGKKSYVSEDLRLACDDRDYNIFVRVLALPLLIFWTTVPLVILRNLKKKKDSLYNFNTIYRYGFFYGEFKHQFFYWEFVRIYFKVTIVLLFTFYRYNLILSYLLGMTFLFAYNKLILILSPQKCKNLKIFEMLSILVLILNSVFSIFGIIYQSQTLDVLIQILHITFILIVIIIICYFQVNNQFNSFGKLLRAVLKFILSDRYYSKIIKGYKIEFKTYLRWKQVRQSIYLIIGRKAINNLDQIQKNSNLVSQNQTNNQNQQQRDQLLQLYQQRFHNISNHQLIKGDSTALNRPQKKSQQKQISQQQVESSEFQSFVSNPIKEDLDEKKIQIMMSPTQSFSNHNIFQLNSVKSQPNLTNEENYQFFSQQLNS